MEARDGERRMAREKVATEAVREREGCKDFRWL